MRVAACADHLQQGVAQLAGVSSILQTGGDGLTVARLLFQDVKQQQPGIGGDADSIESSGDFSVGVKWQTRRAICFAHGHTSLKGLSLLSPFISMRYGLSFDLHPGPVYSFMNFPG